MPFCIGTPTYGTQATDYIDALRKLLAFIDEDNNYVATMAVNAGGSGWAVDDYFDLSGSGVVAQGLQAVGRVTSVSSGAVTGVEIASMGAYSTDPTLTASATTAVSPATGTGLTVDVTMDSLDYVIELDGLIGGGPEREMFVKGIGLDDLQDIYWGIRTYRDVPTDIYNWECVGATGYNNLLDWDNQPGQDVPVDSSGFPSCDIPLLNSTLPFWIYANKQRVSLVLRPSTVYCHGYFGFGLPFGPLNLYPYPLTWQGMASGASDLRFSDLTSSFSNVLDPPDNGVLFRWTDGQNFAIPKVFPHENRWTSLAQGDPNIYTQTAWGRVSDLAWLSDMRDNGGEYPIFPIVLWQESAAIQSYIMQLDRVYWVSGFSLTSEDEVVVNGTKYRVFQNGFRTSTWQFMAYEEV